MVDAKTKSGWPSRTRAATWTPKFTDQGVQTDTSFDLKLDALMFPVLVEVIGRCQDCEKFHCMVKSIEQEETSKLCNEIMAYTEIRHRHGAQIASDEYVDTEPEYHESQPELSIDAESDDHESQPELHESSDEGPILEDDSDEYDKVDVKLGNGGIKER